MKHSYKKMKHQSNVDRQTIKQLNQMIDKYQEMLYTACLHANNLDRFISHLGYKRSFIEDLKQNGTTLVHPNLAIPEIDK